MLERRGDFRSPWGRQGISATGAPTRTRPRVREVDFDAWHDGTIVAFAVVATDEFRTGFCTPLRGEMDTAPVARMSEPAESNPQSGWLRNPGLPGLHCRCGEAQEIPSLPGNLC